MKTYGEICLFLTSALAEVSGQLQAPAALLPEKETGTHWIGGSVGPRTCLDDSEKSNILPLPELELRPLDHPARSNVNSAVATLWG
jgi:hypothetical protein